tara:strand:+ start:104 stop:1378 length:1275 start_codon:yes stop_codon:yes gene_type:complete
MKRAKKDQTDKEKIAIVDAIVKKGSYLKEALNLNKFIKREKSSFGYKTIKCENEINGYDRAFFEILKNDRAKSFFANCYRFLEIGEFKNGKLDGIGGIYLYDFIKKDQVEEVFLFGRFKNGFPEKELYYFSSHQNELRGHLRMDWDNGELIAYFEDSKNARGDFWNVSIIKSSIFYYPYKKISPRTHTYKDKQWWEEYQNLYLTNQRPKIDDLTEKKINEVDSFIKNGKNLEEQFIEAPVKINPSSIFGHKKFFLNKTFGKFIGYDRAFYKTLKNDKAKEHFANYYRKLEIGEFKNGKLHGEGGRYLYDNQENPSLIILWGNFVNGYLNGRVQYITEDDKEGIIVYLSFWSKGELIKLEKRDKEHAIEISEDYYVNPWACLNIYKGVGIIEEDYYEELLKEDEMGFLDAVDWWDEYKKGYQTWP